MSVPTCSVDGCEKPIYQSRNMCGSHYMKWYRYGDPTWRRPMKAEDLTGRTFGSLTVERPAHTSHWHCVCECGRRTVVRAWSLTSGGTVSCGDGQHKRLATVSYGAMHERLRRDMGSASRSLCVDCGQTAAHWSYDHGDPDELDSELGPYSLDPAHYQPRCVPCHKVFDLGRGAA